MPDLILQSESTNELRETSVRLVDSNGIGVTGVAGSAVIKICKPAATTFAASGVGTALTEITGGAGTNGVYRLRLGSTDADTVGDVEYEITHASIVPTYGVVSVRPAHRAVDFADNFITANKIATDAIDADSIKADAATEIGAATWDLTGLSSHRAAGSFGEVMQVMLGLFQGNSMIDNTVYGAQSLLTSARLRVFADATALGAAVAGAANNANGEIFRFTITSVDAGAGQFTSYKLTRNL